MPQTLLTNTGESRIAQAAGSGVAVSITEIALGDGNGANYNPSHAQSALVNERAREPIQSQHMIGGNAWRVRTEFDPNTPTFWVREMGFFDAQGDLIAVWAGSDVTPRQTGAISYLVEHVLSLTRVAEGLVIVDAPDDQVVAISTAMLHEQASQRLAQFHMSEAFHAEHGYYPGG